MRFRVFSVPHSPAINESSVFTKRKTCTAEPCNRLPAWPRKWNYISWNTAIYTYPHFVSDDSAEICWIFAKELVSRHYKLNSKATGNCVCLESSLPKVRSKWIVHLQTPNLNCDNDGDGDNAGAWGDSANTTGLTREGRSWRSLSRGSLFVGHIFYESCVPTISISL